MSETNQKNRKLEDWLTRGRPLSIRTRGAGRLRGRATVPITDIEVKQIKELEELLQHLKEELPEILWVVVVDGSVDSFIEAVSLRIKRTHEDCKFWLVGLEQNEIPESSPLTSLDPLRLNPLSEKDSKFIRNLVADLVIIPFEPKDSRYERVQRWLYQSRYILVQRIDASLIQEIQSTGYARSGRAAEIFIYNPAVTEKRSF